MGTLKRVFLTGLLVLVPIAISLWVLFQLTLFLENILGTLFKNVLKESYVPGIGIVSLLLLILIVGFVTDNLVGRRFLRWFNHLMEKVPLFNKVYHTVKGISDSIFGEGHHKFFEAVVMVPFPKDGTRTIGFVTAVPKEVGEGQVGVFIPTVPNITTGFYLIFPKEDVQFLDMPIEEGIKLVISVGISARSKNEDDKGKTNCTKGL